LFSSSFRSRTPFRCVAFLTPSRHAARTRHAALRSLRGDFLRASDAFASLNALGCAVFVAGTGVPGARARHLPRFTTFTVLLVNVRALSAARHGVRFRFLPCAAFIPYALPSKLLRCAVETRHGCDAILLALFSFARFDHARCSRVRRFSHGLYGRCTALPDAFQRVAFAGAFVYHSLARHHCCVAYSHVVPWRCLFCHFIPSFSWLLALRRSPSRAQHFRLRSVAEHCLALFIFYYRFDFHYASRLPTGDILFCTRFLARFLNVSCRCNLHWTLNCRRFHTNAAYLLVCFLAGRFAAVDLLPARVCTFLLVTRFRFRDVSTRQLPASWRSTLVTTVASFVLPLVHLHVPLSSVLRCRLF